MSTEEMIEGIKMLLKLLPKIDISFVEIDQECKDWLLGTRDWINGRKVGAFSRTRDNSVDLFNFFGEKVENLIKQKYIESNEDSRLSIQWCMDFQEYRESLDKVV